MLKAFNVTLHSLIEPLFLALISALISPGGGVIPNSVAPNPYALFLFHRSVVLDTPDLCVYPVAPSYSESVLKRTAFDAKSVPKKFEGSSIPISFNLCSPSEFDLI